MTNETRGIGKPNQAPPQYQRGINYFLGIAINDYSPPMARLHNCVNDVTKVRDTLLNIYDFEEKNMTLLCDADATRRNIFKALTEVSAKLTTEDSLVLMYSGHGDNPDHSNIGFMIPVDARDEYDFINLSDFKSRLDAARAKHVFVIFDSCFSGLILTQRGGLGINIPENFPSRFALTSGRNSPVSDGNSEHSPFAYALLSELNQNDDRLGAVLLAQKILDRFSEVEKDAAQLPNFGRINDDQKYEGQYYFYPKNYEESFARERIKRLEAEDARRVAEVALINAERERKRAEKLARAATNAATFMQIQDYNPTLATRLMHYNVQNHVGSKLSHSFFYKNISDANMPFYAKILRGHQNWVGSVVFSADGKYLATGSGDDTAKLWDWEKNKEIKAFEGHGNWVTALAFSPDGAFLATASADKTAKIWSIETGKIMQTFTGHQDSVTAIAFSPDGKYVATGSMDTTAKLWNVATGKETKTFVGHKEGITALVFLNNKQIVTGSFDGTAKTWAIATAKPQTTFEGYEGGILCIAVSQNGQYLAVGGTNEVVMIWDMATAQQVKILRGHKSSVNSIAFVPNANYLVTGSEDATAMLWDIEAEYNVEVFKGHQTKVTAIALMPDGSFLATAGADRTAKIWSLAHPRLFIALDDVPEGARNFTALSPDGQYVAKAFDDKTIKLWNVETSKAYKTLNGRQLYISSLVFSPNNAYLATVNADEAATVWTIATGEVRLFSGHTVWLSVANFSADSKYLATGSGDNTAKVWSMETGQELMSFVGHTLSITAIAFSPDGKYLATGNTDTTAKIWDIATGICLLTLTGHQSTIKSVVFSLDGKYVATASEDCTAKLWEVATGKEIFALIGHQKAVDTLVFSPDNRYLATGSFDNTAKLWDIATGKALKTFVGYTRTVFALAFSPDGEKLIAASHNDLQVFDIAKDGIEDRIYPANLFEMAKAGLEFEPEDTPQYIEDFVAYQALTHEDVNNMFKKAKEHLRDDHAIERLKLRLGL
jgi:WD40 repeat protein